jgi:hypothetical protein
LLIFKIFAINIKEMEKSFENTFVIEACENCRSHNWNTRHDESKYKAYAMESK